MAYLAPSLARLRAEVNAKWPGRDRTSDGWIGDTSHQARPSDHNPDPPVIGVVRALDIDVDGVSELDIIAAALRHPATNYVIFNRRIAQRVNGFAWRTYTGANPHDKHVHISIRRGYEAAGESWLGGGGTSTVSNPGPTVTRPAPTAPVITGIPGIDPLPPIKRRRGAGGDEMVIYAAEGSDSPYGILAHNGGFSRLANQEEQDNIIAAGGKVVWVTLNTLQNLIQDVRA